MIINLILFLAFLFILVKSSNYAIKYSSQLAKVLRFPEFIVSFFIIALISVLPEATISIISAINGNPELGLGTLLGSNVTDLTLIFGIVALFSSGGIKVKSKILQNNFFYLLLLLFPLVLGFDGQFSRIDGIILTLSGIIFFIKIGRESRRFRKKFNHTKREPFAKSLILLILSVVILLIGAYLTVRYAVNFAYDIKLPAILIGLTILAFGTCLPELIVSIKAVKTNRDEIALGDILGTVITDATIVLGIVALISPFSYNPQGIYFTGSAMFLAGLFTTIFMKSDKSINKLEGALLILFYVIFIFVEFMINNYFLK
jgi:cation:H+ antiporter